jgi:hypothetical protein
VILKILKPGQIHSNPKILKPFFYSHSSQKIINIAKQFIKTSPTFSYDGISDTLELEITSLDNSDSKFLVEGKFKTPHNGYGNRTKMDLSEDITLHIIEIVIIEDKIISAVIDDQWDELNQITCTTARC